MNFSLLAVRTAAQFLSNPWIICAMIALIFGVAFCCLAKKITVTCKPQEKDIKNTKMFKMWILIGLLLIGVGLLLLIIGTSILVGFFG